jgi:hypothetical protein
LGSLPTSKTRERLPKILGKATDPDGDRLTISAVGSPSTKGGTVALATDNVTYTPPSGFVGSDTFTVSITDGRGGSVTGTLTAIVSAPPSGGSSNGANLVNISAGAGGITFTFYGIPSQVYDIQRSTTLTSWTTIATRTASITGKILYTDTTPLPAAYYRTSTAP